MGEKEKVWFFMWAAVAYVGIGLFLTWRFLKNFNAQGFTWQQFSNGGIWQFVFTWPWSLNLLNGN